MNNTTNEMQNKQEVVQNIIEFETHLVKFFTNSTRIA